MIERLRITSSNLKKKKTEIKRDLQTITSYLAELEDDKTGSVIRKLHQVTLERHYFN